MSCHPPADLEAQKHDLPYPRTITIEDTRHGSGNDDFVITTQYRRTLSRPETGVGGGARLPAEFRTLSIHVETRNSSDEGRAGATRRTAVKELISLDWHKVTKDEALQRLSVSPKTGLETAQAQRRLQSSGKNVISPPKSNILRKLIEWFFGGFGSLLLAASIVCFIAWEPLGYPNPQASNLALAVVLLIVLFVQAIFNAWQDFSTSRVMSSIKGMLPSDVLILRDGTQITLAAADLVTGDLVHLSLGEKVPADLRLIEVSGDLRFDRSLLTGESEPVAGRVDKTDDNFLEARASQVRRYSDICCPDKKCCPAGYSCVSGSGLGLVIQTGDNTVFGRIAKLSSIEPTRLTTLQREILHVVLIIASLATLVAILIVILWAAWLRHDYPNYINVSGLLIDVVSVMVAFIPEGLPVAVTLSLAKIASTLGSHKVLCKSLSIVETLGSVNVLCSDKTGTLTQNKMHVTHAAVFDDLVDPTVLASIIQNAPPESAANLAQMTAVGAICNAATFGGNNIAEQSEKDAERQVLGDATDVAILRFSDSVASADITRSAWTEVFKINFNSKTKFMLKLSRLSLATATNVAPIAPWDKFSPSDYLLTIKGAPEILLPRCKFVLDPQGGEPIALSHAVLERITAVQENWARDGQRVLLLARRVIRESAIPKHLDLNSEQFADLIEGLNGDLIIVGLVGLIDPLKPSIVHTVSTCRRAGIRFFVVTGDHPVTSVAITKQAGIISDEKTMYHASNLDDKLDPLTVEPCNPDEVNPTRKSIAITGPELEQLSDSQVEQLCQYQEVVFARTTPEQKLRIVHEFKKRENVVAMTGDGVNDAPSLKAADCGIAMGAGSDVAKEAADMVLLDDFSAIVVALEYGRLVEFFFIPVTFGLGLLL